MSSSHKKTAIYLNTLIPFFGFILFRSVLELVDPENIVGEQITDTPRCFVCIPVIDCSKHNLVFLFTPSPTYRFSPWTRQISRE